MSLLPPNPSDRPMRRQRQRPSDRRKIRVAVESSGLSKCRSGSQKGCASNARTDNAVECSGSQQSRGKSGTGGDDNADDVSAHCYIDHIAQSNVEPNEAPVEPIGAQSSRSVLSPAAVLADSGSSILLDRLMEPYPTMEENSEHVHSCHELEARSNSEDSDSPSSSTTPNVTKGVGCSAENVCDQTESKSIAGGEASHTTMREENKVATVLVETHNYNNALAFLEQPTSHSECRNSDERPVIEAETETAQRREPIENLKNKSHRRMSASQRRWRKLASMKKGDGKVATLTKPVASTATHDTDRCDAVVKHKNRCDSSSPANRKTSVSLSASPDLRRLQLYMWNAALAKQYHSDHRGQHFGGV